MSIPVPLDRLAEVVAEFGRTGYLVTVGTDGRPRVNHVRFDVVDGSLRAPVGRRTAEAIAGGASVCCLWPGSPSRGDGMNLVVDGEARLERSDAGGGAGAEAGAGVTVAHITVTWAVRHAPPAG